MLDSDRLYISAITKWIKNKFNTKMTVKLVIWEGHITCDQNNGTIANCSSGSYKKLNWNTVLSIIWKYGVITESNCRQIG